MTKEKNNHEDKNIDLILRPTSWSDYVGQENVKKNLKMIMDAARKRGEVCDHLLFYGQAGLGKTTLANLLAKEMGTNIKTTTGPALEKAGDLVAILTNLEPNDILFIDEIHRVNKLIEEIFYPAMESRKIHLIIGKGPSARSFSLDLPPFTLVGATVRVSLLSNPFRSRFGATFKLDYYNLENVEKILQRSARLLGVELDTPALKILARASRFTPRVANRLLKRARDFTEVYSHGKIDEEVAVKTLAMLEIDEMGLEAYDRRLINTIIEKFNGGPVGLKNLAASLSEDEGSIEEVYEPYLMTLGFLSRTSAGRVATQAAYEYFKIKNKGLGV
ncbi:MAG: Holliday junction branch migration DNA helicase RuvB [bacterium]|nr:Holliday junction branch migration DNA helicase RuvB [bacterium]